MINTIICPYCKKPVEITQAFKQQIEKQVIASLDEQHKKELEDVKRQVADKIRKEQEEKTSLEIADLEKQLKEKEKKVAELRNYELKLREEKRALEEEKKELKLEAQRQIDREKKKIEEAVLKQAVEEHRLKDLEKDKIIQDLRKSVEDLERKAKQGSQQLQGEVLELDLEQILQQTFPQDGVEEVGKGVAGADIRQIVKSPSGKTSCGVILWESKRTKAWSDSWITKLKADLRKEGADLSAIVSVSLPKEAKEGIGFKDGVWICSPQLIVPLALLLRDTLIKITYQKVASSHQGRKADLIYEYIISHQFRQQIEAIIESYEEMRSQIDKERTAYERSWKQREGQLQRIILSTANLYGSIQGLAGASALPQIKGLDFPELETGGNKRK